MDSTTLSPKRIQIPGRRGWHDLGIWHVERATCPDSVALVCFDTGVIVATEEGRIISPVSLD